MTTIKSYTDIEQSYKLAKILPIESADYTHLGKNEDNVLTRPYLESCSSGLGEWIGKDEIYPCWSLAGLLSVLPKVQGFKPIISLQYNYITYPYKSNLYTKADSITDACYEMILELHKLNLL